MSQVFFLPPGGQDKVGPVLRKLLADDFAGQDVLVKVHFGERNNQWYVKPEFVKIVTDELKGMGSTPFLFDTTVIYGGQRTTREKHERLAREHGFDRIGCAVVIGDRGQPVPLSEEGIDFRFEVAEELHRSRSVVSIVHAKGHSLTGFAGTLKNLGMGGVSKACKLAMHTASLRRKVATLGRSPVTFNKILAMGAKACLLGKNVAAVHVLLDITRECDCARNALPIICPDLGYLLSRDPVAVEAASIDMITQRAGPGVFKRDPWEQVACAVKIGLGSRNYELVAP